MSIAAATFEAYAFHAHATTVVVSRQEIFEVLAEPRADDRHVGYHTVAWMLEPRW